MCGQGLDRGEEPYQDLDRGEELYPESETSAVLARARGEELYPESKPTHTRRSSTQRASRPGALPREQADPWGGDLSGGAFYIESVVRECPTRGVL